MSRLAVKAGSLGSFEFESCRILIERHNRKWIFADRKAGFLPAMIDFCGHMWGLT